MRELNALRQGVRVVLAGDVRTIADRELIRSLVADAIAGMAPEDQPELVLDVADAGYLDTYALLTIAGVARKCVDVGMTLTLEGASEELIDLLRATRIDQVLGKHGARLSPARPAV